MLTAIDCQGFAGGFTLGMVRAGFHLVGKREMRDGFGGENCLVNRHLLGDDWTYEACETQDWTPEPVDVVFGNPPCSGFSLLSGREFRGVNSPANSCMWEFIHFAARCEPRVAIFESVSQAYTSGRPLMQALRERLELLTGQQYELVHVIHNNIAIGGAAIRKRYFAMFIRADVHFSIEKHVPDRIPTLIETIGDLQDLEVKWEWQPYQDTPSWWAADRVSDRMGTDGHMTYDTPYSERALDVFDCVGEWGPRELMSEVARKCYEQTGDLPDSWYETLKNRFVDRDFKMGFNQACRWDPNRSARVITGGALETLIHPTRRRFLTHREAARIQGFPDDWRIEPLKSVKRLQLTWGKGIPVDCGEWIGHEISEVLQGNDDVGRITGEHVGDRERTIDVSRAFWHLTSER